MRGALKARCRSCENRLTLPGAEPGGGGGVSLTKRRAGVAPTPIRRACGARRGRRPGGHRPAAARSSLLDADPHLHSFRPCSLVASSRAGTPTSPGRPRSSPRRRQGRRPRSPAASRRRGHPGDVASRWPRRRRPRRCPPVSRTRPSRASPTWRAWPATSSGRCRLAEADCPFANPLHDPLSFVFHIEVQGGRMTEVHLAWAGRRVGDQIEPLRPRAAELDAYAACLAPRLEAVVMDPAPGGRGLPARVQLPRAPAALGRPRPTPGYRAEVAAASGGPRSGRRGGSPTAVREPAGSRGVEAVVSTVSKTTGACQRVSPSGVRVMTLPGLEELARGDLPHLEAHPLVVGRVRVEDEGVVARGQGASPRSSGPSSSPSARTASCAGCRSPRRAAPWPRRSPAPTAWSGGTPAPRAASTVWMVIAGRPMASTPPAAPAPGAAAEPEWS